MAAVEKQQQQQAKKVTGCVKDALGEPIIGASVVEKGAPTNGTITDFDGNFTLTVSGNELQISYIGYLPQVVKVQSGVTSYNVTLKEDTKTLDEVVVIGYGTQKKVNLTGAVASVSTDDIKDRVQTNVLSAVQGTVPGVTIILVRVQHLLLISVVVVIWELSATIICDRWCYCRCYGIFQS